MLKKIEVKKFTGNNLAVSASDGKKLFVEIKAHFDNNDNVELDFNGIILTISAFLNTAIGQLYAYYPQEKIKDLLSVINMDNDDLRILQLVVSQAKVRFENFPHLDQSDIDAISDE